jgi:hypothetical protein
VSRDNRDELSDAEGELRTGVSGVKWLKTRLAGLRFGLAGRVMEVLRICRPEVMDESSSDRATRVLDQFHSSSEHSITYTYSHLDLRRTDKRLDLSARD